MLLMLLMMLVLLLLLLLVLQAAVCVGGGSLYPSMVVMYVLVPGPVAAGLGSTGSSSI